ncbi:MAG TPA: CerR family C-terminal domain-containing protein [Planctomycetaceae bacterium]|nr:CerR family C-terminal domain-containing protein [Planctomycetaceae bacterium]
MDDTKQRLINAAGEIFADKGYEAASIRDICQRADANLAAVNYHFGEKRQLYVAAVRHAQCCRQEDIPFPDWPAEMPAVERLRAFIETMFARMLAGDRPRWHLEIMLRELARPTEACATVVEDYIRPMADKLRSILLDLLPEQLTEQQRWMIGFSIVGQILFYYVHQPIIRLLIGHVGIEPIPLDQLADHVARFTLAAIGAGPSVIATGSPS